MKRILISWIFFLLLLSSSTAQNNYHNPLSRIGIGDISFGHTYESRGRGYLTTASHSESALFIQNPASLGAIRSTLFDIGVFARYSSWSDEEETDAFWSGNIDYIRLGIALVNPINEALEQKPKDYYLGLSLNLSPITAVDYDYSFSSYGVDSLQLIQELNGSGGVYQFEAALGGEYRQLRLGLAAKYYFGNIQHQQVIFVPDFNPSFLSENRREVSFSDIGFKAGAQYVFRLFNSDNEELRLDDKKWLTVGAWYDFGTDISTETDLLVRRIGTTSPPRVDTFASLSDEEGTTHLPSGYSIGVEYRKGRSWTAGVQYTFQQWSQYNSSSLPVEDYNDTYIISTGFSWVPDFNSINNYWDRVTYKGGFLFGRKDPQTLGGEETSFWAATAGITLPFVRQRFFSLLHIYGETGGRGVVDYLYENYVKVGIGLTFGDSQWFIRRKYD